VSRAVKGGLVAVILIGALALRIGEVEGTSYRPRNDAGSYLTIATYIARTGDYSLSHEPGSGAFELLGEVAGLIALLLAAIYPVLIELSVTLVAENLLTALVLAAVYAALRVRRARSARTAYMGNGV
jgi:hypothetical protein